VKLAARGTDFLLGLFFKFYDTGEMFFLKNQLTFSELQKTTSQKMELIMKQSHSCEASSRLTFQKTFTSYIETEASLQRSQETQRQLNPTSLPNVR
jgi:hypothetical protein